MQSILILLAFIFAPFVSAENAVVNFTVEAFKKAQNDKKVVFVHIYKKGCFVCASQKPLFEEAAADNPKAVYMKADWQDKNLKELPKASDGFDFYQKNGTIAAFLDNKNIANLRGITNSQILTDFLENPKHTFHRGPYGSGKHPTPEDIEADKIQSFITTSIVRH